MSAAPQESGLDGPWRKLGPGVWSFATEGFGMNTGLVLGSEKGLVIDSGAGPLQAREIYRSVRQLTELPLAVVNTHAHGDHYFGNSYFAAQGVNEFWATARCSEVSFERGEAQRGLVAGVEPGMAAEDGDFTDIVPANNLVQGVPVDLDLGGVSVTLFYLGRGHTDHDLLVGAGNVLFTGDLVEQGADPAFEDSFPADWIRTLGKIVALEDLYEVFVPGHGSAVGVDYVATQLNRMRSAIRVTKVAMDEASTDMTKAIPLLPYGPEQSRALLIRLRTLAHWQWLDRQQ